MFATPNPFGVAVGQVEPVCPKNTYKAFVAPVSGVNQVFSAPVDNTITMACDTLLDHNGVFMLPDLEYTASSVGNIYTVLDYLVMGDQLDSLATTDPDSIKYTREFYIIVDTTGANQVISHPWLEDHASVNDLNCTINGIALVPTVDFAFVGGSIQVFAYMSAGDWFGVLPSAKLTYTGTVPQLTFLTTVSTNNQMFTNASLSAYTKAEDLILTSNGVFLQPTTDYTLSGSTITVIPFLLSNTYLTVFANVASC